MIQIRKSNGEVVKVEGSAFVEVVNDLDQTIGTVIYSPRPGAVYQIWPGSVDAARYAGMFSKQGATFAQNIIQRAA